MDYFIALVDMEHDLKMKSIENENDRLKSMLWFRFDVNDVIGMFRIQNDVNSRNILWMAMMIFPQ